MQVKIGYFVAEERLKKAGLRVEPLIDGGMIVLPRDALCVVIPRPAGKLPEYDPAAIDLVISTMKAFSADNAENELTPEQLDLFCRSVSKEQPEGKE